MPLRDHFRPPLTDHTTWEGIHGQWPAVIVQQLVTTLPPQYVAEPRVHLGAQAEIDIAAYDRDPTRLRDGEAGSPADTAASWSPAEPTLAVETALADFDEYEVRVYDARRGRRLVAAVELISPANKDRPENRAQFVSKCAALLRQQVSVVLVDVVTVRQVNLYAELLQWIAQRDPTLGDDPPPTYAVASRWRPRGANRWLETWSHRLTVGDPLPAVPLWLTEELAIRLDLEDSYERTCRDLRIAK